MLTDYVDREFRKNIAGKACVCPVWSFSWKYLKVGSDATTASLDYLKAFQSAWRLAWETSEARLLTGAPVPRSSALLASSQHGALRIVRLLTWQPGPQCEILVKKSEATCPLWLSLRSHAWPLLPHPISCMKVTSRFGFWRRGHRLFLLKEECGLRDFWGHLWKI